MPAITRIYGLDLARSIAVFVAAFSHSISAFGGMAITSEPVLLFFRTASPTFIIVFGVFLELVYFTSMKTKGMPYTTKKLLSRAIQCYMLYVMSCVVLTITDGYSLSYLARMVLLLGATPFTDILKFYAAMLFLAPLLLTIKAKYGLRPLIAFCLVVQVLHYFFYPEPYYKGLPGSDTLFGFLYGATTAIAGPSVLHGITFVVTGMWLGEYIRGNLERNRLLDWGKPAVICLLAVCAAALLIIGYNYGPGFTTELSGMKLRNSNSYIYFLFGIAGAILVIDLSMRLAEIIGAKRIKGWVFLGNTSLFTFSFGNCILYIFRTDKLEKADAMAATFAALFCIILLSWTFNYIRNKISKSQSTSKWLQAYHYISKGYADQCAGKLVARA